MRRPEESACASQLSTFNKVWITAFEAGKQVALADVKILQDENARLQEGAVESAQPVNLLCVNISFVTVGLQVQLIP